MAFSAPLPGLNAIFHRPSFFGSAAAAVIAVIVWTASPPALAADAAPYTEVAARSLDRASKFVEAPRPAKDDPTSRLAALVSYLDAVYAKAGYSFDKSYARYLADYQKTHVPELHVAATPLTQALGAMLDLEPQGAQLDHIFKGETLRLAKAVAAQSRREADEKNAAATRSQQAAEAARSEELERAMARMGPLAQGRYWRDGHEHAQFVDLAWNGGGSLTVSAEHFSKNRTSSLLCKLPPVDVPVKAYRGKELSGEASSQDCKVELRVTEAAVTLRLGGGRGCAALCAADGKPSGWEGGLYWSDEIRRRFADAAAEQKNATMTPEQQSLQDELRSRTASGTSSSADKASPKPTQDDPSNALKDATRVFDGLFKKR